MLHDASVAIVTGFLKNKICIKLNLTAILNIIIM